ncbi:MAG: MerR family transcriptional regulator [Candidatus Omnitrophica bacterium]|nr:MerR family transcriptional regulator [Candidatus Omnitrophota bacterium]
MSRKTGCSIYTIKFYYKLGLIKEIGRSPYTNFRYFDESSVKRLEKVRALRKERLSLGEIRKKLLVEA